MSDFQVLEIGPLAEWGAHFGGFTPETSIMGRRFIDHELPLEYIGVSANSRLPGDGADYWHTHSVLEELYIFLEGEGVIALDDEVVPVKAGTTVRVGQGVRRSWHCNADSTTALKWLCIRAGGATLAAIPKDSHTSPEVPLPWA